ncbi:adhesion G protein-coupled receptor F5-like [Poecilia formosa]|uniref:adhesion G protein-coupled receptor F5-like n=1 Tax=Poecilia formosa TaxID=48698 RepID=UPI0007B91A29|nr:PREDICTED: adhesion G protein-coupled receptor F5-like [Poecilia formosa]
MVFPKAVWFGFIPLVICYTESQPGFTALYEDMMEINSLLHERQKREAPTNDYEFQAVLGLSELEVLELFLNNPSFPILINGTSQISSMDTTTVCSPHIAGYLCVCEENFAWSNNTCIAYGVCDVMRGDTCGCINDLPADGQFCQLNSSQTDAADINVGIVLFIPTSSVSSSIFSSFRSTLQNISFPLALSQSVGVKEMSFTTACDPNSANGLQCQCESGFAWPCDTCNSNTNSCNNQTCTCLYGLPPNDEFCQPVTNEEVNTTTVFAGEEMTVTCGPPPEELSFGLVKSVEWTHMGTVIEKGFSLKNGQSVLKLPSFFPLNDGIYICKLKRGDNSTFKQSINAKAIPIPQIIVNPVNMSVECEKQHSVSLNCFVNNGYTVTFLNTDVKEGSHVTHTYTVEKCSITKIFTCESKNSSKFTKNITLMLYPSNNITCRNDTFGNGPLGFVAKLGCKEGKVGEITAVCQETGNYGQIQDNCVLEVVKNLLDQSEVLDELTLPQFLEQLSNVTVNFTDEITDSPANIDAIVRILSNVANLSSSLGIKIEQDLMRNILETAGTLTIGKAKTSWESLNNNTRNTDETKLKSASSSLLYSIENITSHLVNKSFSIETPHICLNKSTFVNTFSGDLNSSVKIDIPDTGGRSHSITTIVFYYMDNVLPARDKSNSSSKVINGKVALIWPENKITNISLAFDVLHDKLRNPECVFWDFSLFGGLGGWNDDGCMLVFNENGTISCHCNHTTTFSILMSPNSPDNFILAYITYNGVACSIVSLIICLIIEGIIWKSIGDNMTSYFRHVSIVNIALSLLIADIWFIIGAAISDADQKNPPACTATTFFIHFFYLALFFWMLASALLLLYRTFNVFDGGLSKRAMLIIGFSLGYGAPLIIATITIAVTAPSNHYTRENNVCWLAWDTHKTLLAFVIPALTIVAINFIILTLVISKILRRRVGMIGAQARERHALLVIVRCSAVLTPIFGVTWALGFGTMVSPENFGLHVAFALLNSLQGFCILLFGTLLDKKTTSPASFFTVLKLFWRSKVRMALPKVIRLAVVLLVICCALDKPGFRHSVSVFFEELMAVKSPSIHVREKRETFTNVTDYEFQVILSLSELEILQTILNNLSFPITINSTSEISNIDATTVCSRNISGYQCVCEENFAWSYNSCITYGVCDAIDGDTCGCINELPADGQFCQLNSSQTELVDFDVTLDLHIPLSGVPDDILELIRSVLGNETFPATISQSVEVKELLLTTDNSFCPTPNPGMYRIKTSTNIDNDDNSHAKYNNTISSNNFCHPNHYNCNGNHYTRNGNHYTRNGNHYTRNGNHDTCNGNHYTCNGNHNIHPNHINCHANHNICHAYLYDCHANHGNRLSEYINSFINLCRQCGTKHS